MDRILNRFFSGAGVVLTMLVDSHSHFYDKPFQRHEVLLAFSFSSSYQKIRDKSSKNGEKLANFLQDGVI
jgi:hypothetical protein